MVELRRLETLGGRLKDVREKDLRIRSRRKLCGLLRAQGVDIEPQGNTLGRYEADKRPPPADLVRVVADMANVNAGWLLTGRGDRYLTGQAAEETLSRIRALLQPREVGLEEIGLDPEPE